jgi:class 3 adenylate cyclase/CHASE2 domain-containing sensor protein
MWLRRHFRPVVVALAVAAGAASAALTGGQIAGDGFFYDLALGVRARLAPPPRDEEPVAVIAVDRRSLRAPELRALPRVLFTPHWARLVEAVVEAGAKSVGFDFLFAWSSAAFLPDNERDFLRVLAANRDRVVLARSAAWSPAPPYFYAIGAGQDPNSLGFVELAPDGDGVYRRVPASLSGPDGAVPSFAAALAAKAGLPAMTEPILLAPRRPLSEIPSYSLIDVLRCAEVDPARLRRVFAGRIVVVGSVLPDEDRKQPLDRFFAHAPPRGLAPPEDGCHLEAEIVGREGATVPGIMIHAEALVEYARGRLTRPITTPTAVALNAVAAGLGAAIGLLLAPALALLAGALLIALLFAISGVALGDLIWLPIALPIATVAAAIFLAYVARYLVEDRRRRQIQAAFGHYLAPSIVQQLANADALPKLGGETGAVSVMFADLSGFTALSGRVGPEALVAMTNTYLGYIAEAVEQTGGYVDKFIGDAVMAIWGAPVVDPDHAANAVRAARAAIARVDAAHAEAEARGEHGFRVKIGIHSGPATVGNVGWLRRFNYTAIGETVNIAARLESVPGDYDCRLVVGEPTAAAAGAFAFCELDWLRVKGKVEPIGVYEPLGAADAANAIDGYAAGYAEALAAYRAGDFARARDLWSALDYGAVGGEIGAGGGPPAVMAARAADFLDSPPPEPWDGVWSKDTK